jgi:Uma2 family endonuclease
MRQRLTRVRTYSDYLAIPEDGRRHELIAGELQVTPAPGPLHQRVSRRLLLQLVDYFHPRSLGEVFVAPIDLILGWRDVVQPDLLVVDDATQITERGIEAAPLLVVEILSASTADRDRGVKARRYAELGVRHYWIVDPVARRLECQRRRAGVFEVVAAAEGDAHLAHPDWDGLVIDLAALWAPSEAPRAS